MVPNDRIRVLIADDHPLYRAGLVDTVKRRAELELVGQAEDGAEALDEIRSLSPDVCVLEHPPVSARHAHGAVPVGARGTSAKKRSQ